MLSRLTHIINAITPLTILAINPCDMTPEENHDLAVVLSEIYKNRKTRKNLYLKKGLNVIEIDTPAGKKHSVYLYLKHPLVYRRCESNPKKDYRFEIQGDEIGHGTYSKVYLSRGVLVSGVDNTLSLKPSPRIIKHQTHYDAYPASRAKREAKLGRRTPSRSKKPTVINDGTESYMVSKFFPGQSLFNVIDGQMTSFSADELIKWSLTTLYALQEIHLQDIAHLDIKPENIMANGPVKQPKINIFDYGTSKLSAHNNAGEECGTLGYSAPEMCENKNCGKKSDVFSAAILLSLFFRAAPQRANSEDTKNIRDTAEFYYMAYQDALNCKFENLFDGISDLDEEEKKRIAALLSLMTKAKEADRCELDEAVRVFEEIFIKRKLRAVSDLNLRGEISNALNLAIDLRRKTHAVYGDCFRVMQTNLYELQKLPDHPEVISDFLFLLGINALQKCKNKQEIISETEKIIHDYQNKLEQLQKKNTELIALQNQFAHPNEQTEKVIAGNHEILRRSSHSRLTLDEMVDLTRSLNKEINRVELVHPLRIPKKKLERPVARTKSDLPVQHQDKRKTFGLFHSTTNGYKHASRAGLSRITHSR